MTLERRASVPDSRWGQEGDDRTLKRRLGKGEVWPLGCVAQRELESREMSMCVGGVYVCEGDRARFLVATQARVLTLFSAPHTEWASGQQVTFPEVLLSQGVRDMHPQDRKTSWHT